MRCGCNGICDQEYQFCEIMTPSTSNSGHEFFTMRARSLPSKIISTTTTTTTLLNYYQNLKVFLGFKEKLMQEINLEINTGSNALGNTTETECLKMCRVFFS